MGLAHHLWESPHDRGMYTGDDVSYLLVVEHLKQARVVNEILKGKESKFLRKAGVVGAMFATTHKAQANSMKFWAGVRDGTNLTADDARLSLRNELMQVTQHAVAGRGAQVLVDAESLYRWCGLAWNCWRKGKKWSRPRHIIEERPTLK